MGKTKKTNIECPYCGDMNVQENVYIVSEGYRDWCPKCGRSRMSRDLIKKIIVGTILMIIWFTLEIVFDK